jgi:ABC-type transporter Mla subunit MlaD
VKLSDKLDGNKDKLERTIQPLNEMADREVHRTPEIENTYDNLQKINQDVNDILGKSA